MKPVRFGVISTARIGLERVILAMQRGKHTKIDAIASRDPAKAKAIAEQFGIPKAYGSYEELLADPLIEAARAGKHMLCEKPLALDAKEAATLDFPLEDAVKNMAVIDAIYRSSESGGWETVSG